MGKRKITKPDPLQRFRPIQFLDFADQFYSAFHELRKRPPPFSWPRYFLLCHSIELALKAYLAEHGATVDQLKDDFGHKLDKLVDKAAKKDLPLPTTTQETISSSTKPIQVTGTAIQAKALSTSSSSSSQLLASYSPL
jgi:hypothetical protein